MPGGHTLTCDLTVVGRKHLGIRLVFTDEETSEQQVSIVVLDREQAIDLACRFLAANRFLVLAQAPAGRPPLN